MIRVFFGRVGTNYVSILRGAGHVRDWFKGIINAADELSRGRGNVNTAEVPSAKGFLIRDEEKMAKRKKQRDKTGKGANRVSRKSTKTPSLSKYFNLFNQLEYKKLLTELEDVDLSDAKGVYAYLKAHCYLNLGEFARAHEAISLSLSLDPGNVDFQLAYGLCLDKGGDWVRAMAVFNEIIKSHPEEKRAYGHLANVLIQMGRYEFAITCFKKLLSIGGDKSACLIKLGFCHHRLGQLDRAINYYEQAIEVGEHLDVVWGEIAGVFESKGDKEMARTAYKQAISLAPKNYLLYRNYANLGDLPQEDREEIVGRLNTALQTEKLDSGSLRGLHFALAKLNHDLKNYDTAFRHYELANHYRALVLGSPFSTEAYRTQLAFFRSQIDEDFFSRERGNSSFSKKPVFIVGMPRSGTTLLEQIIASHPSGGGAGELLTIHQLSGEFTSSDGEVRFEKIDSLGPEGIERLAASYLNQLQSIGGTAERIVDKMPGNLSLIWFIALLFPNAPIIHCVRDPRDTCLSCFMHDFFVSHTYKKDLYTLGRYYTMYTGLMSHWKKVAPNPILTVEYEQVVSAPEEMARKIIAHIGLEWDPACLTFRDKEHFSLTASNLQIRKGIYQSSVQRWKPYEKHLGPLLKGLAEG